MLKSLLNELAERKIEIEKLTERVDHLEVNTDFYNSLSNCFLFSQKSISLSFHSLFKRILVI